MSKITAFSLTALRNEEILGMSLEMAEKIRLFNSVANSVQGKAFLDSISDYATALDQEKILTYKDLSKADEAVDQAVSGLRLHLQSLLIYPEENTREAARQIWNSINQYGNPTKLNFQEEYAIVARMLDTLEALDQAIPQKATVSAWIPSLRERYNTFMTMLKAYDAERAAISPATLKTARQKIFNTWKSLCDFINGLAIISPSDEIETLIAEMNARIQSKKNALKLRKTTKKSATDILDEPVQIED